MKRLLYLRLWCLGLFWAGLVVGWNLEAELSRAEIMDLFAQGNEFFRQANEAALEDREEAGDLYQKAGRRFERIIREGGVRNGKLFYNLGNTYCRRNDLGRAILNYRRAERYLPGDPHLKQSLAYARQQRLDRIEESPRARLLKRGLLWHDTLSSRTRVALLVMYFLLFWAGAALRLFFRSRFLSWYCGIWGVAWVLLFASVLVEIVVLREARRGVIVEPEVLARKGDSDSYEPSFQEPLHAGTEFVLVESRPGWVYVELVDARRCWLPAKGVEFEK